VSDPILDGGVTEAASTRRMLNFMVLLVPFGLTAGFVGGALGPHLRAEGLSMTDVTAVTAATSLPHLIKFLWAPVVDLTLSRRAWYWISSAVVAIAYFGLTAIPAHGHVGLLTALVIAQAVAATVLGMALDSLLAHHTTPEQKGKAAGWFQAGNLSGSAVGAAVGLWLIDHVEAWLAGAVMAALVLGCGGGLLWIQERGGRHGGKLGPALRGLLRDLWQVLSSRRGLIAVLLFAAPIGIGSLPLLTAAGDWDVSHELLEMFNGWISPPLVIVGCLLGGRLSDRMDRAYAYLGASLAIVVTTVPFGLLPHTPTVWLVVGSLYTLMTGVAYGAYGGFVLDTAGTGAVATKYNILASFANLPIWYMARLDGIAYDKWHTDGMVWFDAGLDLFGCLAVFAVIQLLLRRRPR
jgi:PAT family beta-lactamase induction signal transducer AmpG